VATGSESLLSAVAGGSAGAVDASAGVSGTDGTETPTASASAFSWSTADWGSANAGCGDASAEARPGSASQKATAVAATTVSRSANLVEVRPNIPAPVMSP